MPSRREVHFARKSSGDFALDAIFIEKRFATLVKAHVVGALGQEDRKEQSPKSELKSKSGEKDSATSAPAPTKSETPEIKSEKREETVAAKL